MIQSQSGWRQVLLPSRPNRSAGWIPEDARLQLAHSTYLIRVQTRSRQVTVLSGGHTVARWTVAVGEPKTPTPLGRTFVLVTLAPPQPTYSSLIFPLGSHSDVLETFGGGPGTIAFHTWPDPRVYGHAVTHGCVRVPKEALRILSRIPLGTPVIVTA